MPAITQRGLQLPFQEVDVREGGSPRFTLEPGFQSASRTLKVAWSDAVLACQQLVGYSALETDEATGDGRIRRWLPAQFPLMPTAICRKASVRGFGAFLGGDPPSYQDVPVYGRIAQYPHALIDVDYQTTLFQLQMDAEAETASQDGEYTELFRFLEYTERQSSRYLSFPVGAFAWSEGPSGPQVGPPPKGGAKFPGNPGRIECSREQHLKMLDWPLQAYPKTAIGKCLGHVNKYDFGDAAAHTLLMLSVERKQTVNPLGNYSLEIEYVFANFKPGQNDLFDFHPNARAYYQISGDGVFYDPGSAPDGKLLFDESDYAELFVPEPP